MWLQVMLWRLNNNFINKTKGNLSFYQSFQQSQIKYRYIYQIQVDWSDSFYIIYNNNSIRMGLWPWAFFSQIFTPKFWRSLKTDGLIQTYQRGHKAVMNTHTVGGNSERTRLVGTDQYGNKYYEDFDPLYRNQRRWVEYNDFLSVRSPNGDMVPPKWHGWLSYQYDDSPVPESPSFYDPFFEKPHQWNYSYSPFKLYTSRMSNANDRALDYAQYRNNRYAREWQPKTKRA